MMAQLALLVLMAPFMLFAVQEMKQHLCYNATYFVKTSCFRGRRVMTMKRVLFTTASPGFERGRSHVTQTSI
jgi:hypothetical protein